jgi:hypothetical protein
LKIEIFHHNLTSDFLRQKFRGWERRHNQREDIGVGLKVLTWADYSQAGSVEREEAEKDE